VCAPSLCLVIRPSSLTMLSGYKPDSCQCCNIYNSNHLRQCNRMFIILKLSDLSNYNSIWSPSCRFKSSGFGPRE
jgi:hypothetical protein